MEKKIEPWYEPENMTDCENGCQHCWIWDYEQQIYICDECGVEEPNQEN